MFSDLDLGIMCEGFGHNRCTAQAIYVVQVHLVDYCRKSERVNVNGDRQFLLCPLCAQKVSDRTAVFIERAFHGQPDNCRDCGKVITAVHHLFALERLVKA